jgi:ABC-type multidrug transport system ATPase subunit
MQLHQEQADLLELVEVTKDFISPISRHRVRALGGVSFTMGPGQIVGLVGPNGSGKTTLFRIITGLLKSDGGRVRLLAQPAGSLPARLVTGYMPEQPGLPGTLTPREVLTFTARIFGLKRSEGSARIRDLEGLLALSPYMDRRMSKLSKGMGKRVGLATALLNHPKVLLLDEPLEGLDPLGSSKVKTHLKALAAGGAGVLISSHILSDVEAVCTHIIILNEGKVLLKGERDVILAARDRIEISFQAPEGEALIAELCRRIEEKGGKVAFAGHPREELETLFKNILEGGEGVPPGTQP